MTTRLFSRASGSAMNGLRIRPWPGAAGAGPITTTSGMMRMQCRHQLWTRPSSPPAIPPSWSALLTRTLTRKNDALTRLPITRSYRGGGGSSVPRLRLPEGDALIYGIIGANVAVFGAWTWASSSYANTRFMLENFTCSARGVVNELRLHTLVTSMFSHNSFGHLLVNSITLYFFGAEAVAILGARRFLNLYLSGGLVSSLCCVAWPYVAPGLNIPASYRVSKHTSALGASGAINAVVAWSIFTFPSRMIYIYMILPVPAALVGALYLVKDLSGLYKGGGGEANAGHLGGALVGATYFFMSRGRYY